MTDLLLIDKADDIATVTLNRPEKMNALSKALWAAVGDAMQALSG
ncbi:MAG: hypothetical protein R2911_35580 [Caldilineaceae bacterium]